MKRIITFSVTCLSLLLFFSCKNSVEVMKRHYTNGFYVSHTKGTNKVKENSTAGSSHSARHTEKVEVLNAIPVKTISGTKYEPVLTASIKENPVFLKKGAKTASTPYVMSTAKRSALHKASTLNTPKSIFKHSQYRGKSEKDIVTILLCIFIPPLAVYLYEDDLTTNFWIDLILTILFWLPGMIFAFLVVFEVI